MSGCRYIAARRAAVAVAAVPVTVGRVEPSRVTGRVILVDLHHRCFICSAKWLLDSVSHVMRYPRWASIHLLQNS